MKLEGKVAIVTGASSGIGRAGALALAEAGADVVVNGRSQMQKAEEVAHLIEAMGRKALAVRSDVSKSEDVDRLVSQTVDTLGKVDVLFNNAGIFESATLEEDSDEMWHRIIDVHLTGHFHCCRRVVPEMKKLGKGKIINNGSIFGHQGVPNAVAYGVAKMGIHGLTPSAAAVHADWRDDALRDDEPASARSLRLGLPSGLLQRGSGRQDRRAFGEDS